MMETTGPVFNFHILWDDAIVTASPEHIKIILATDFNNYEKGRCWTLHNRLRISCALF
jgi:hypothetical protein